MIVTRLVSALLGLVGFVGAHGGEHQKPLVVDPNADWATRHMAEEHHISTFDGPSFFTLHDYDDNGMWDRAEILKTYGFTDPSAASLPPAKREEVARTIMALLDRNGNGVVERAEWTAFLDAGGVLPDLATGPGHHWDMETEYEIHHWERFHDENTKEEDLIHPEDIEHFRLHDQLEDEELRVQALDRMMIVEQNIPPKFRR